MGGDFFTSRSSKVRKHEILQKTLKEDACLQNTETLILVMGYEIADT